MARCFGNQRTASRNSRVTALILVTGASGNVGGQALRTLLSQGFSAAGMVRSARRAEALPSGISVRIASYDDPTSLLRAFDGVSTLLFISSDGDGRNVLRHHANVIDAAAAQRVSSIIFTSIIDVDSASPFYYAPVYRDAERRMAECGINLTILRCGLYSDFILDSWIKPALDVGILSLPVGAAQVAPISRIDVALAVASVASSPARHAGKTYELTGREALSFRDLAELGGKTFGLPLEFVPCSPADYLQRTWMELEDPWPHAFSSLCRSVAEGRYAQTSNAAEFLLGRRVVGFDAFMRNAAQSEKRT